MSNWICQRKNLADARCTQHYCWCTQHFLKMPKLPLCFLRSCVRCAWGLQIKLIRKRLTGQLLWINLKGLRIKGISVLLLSSSSSFQWFRNSSSSLWLKKSKSLSFYNKVKRIREIHFNSMDANREQIVVDVESVVEAVCADDGHAPLYNIKSLCMRCHENVNFFLL